MLEPFVLLSEAVNVSGSGSMPKPSPNWRVKFSVAFVGASWNNPSLNG